MLKAKWHFFANIAFKNLSRGNERANLFEICVKQFLCVLIAKLHCVLQVFLC